MKPIEFPEQNVVFGKNQPEYLPLPTLLATDGSATTCWELEPGELEEIQKTGKIWFNQLTFFQPLQPIRPHAFKPELKEAVQIEQKPEPIVIDNFTKEGFEKTMETLEEHELPKHHVLFNPKGKKG